MSLGPPIAQYFWECVDAARSLLRLIVKSRWGGVQGTHKRSLTTDGSWELPCSKKYELLHRCCSPLFWYIYHPAPLAQLLVLPLNRNQINSTIEVLATELVAPYRHAQLPLVNASSIVSTSCAVQLKSPTLNIWRGMEQVGGQDRRRSTRSTWTSTETRISSRQLEPRYLGKLSNADCPNIVGVLCRSVRRKNQSNR